MEVIPAIDLRGGRCVRLYQGDYGRESVYSEDPLKVAAHWAAQGAHRLHVVDLDGAREGALGHLSVVEGIASSVPALIQLGGGIRTLETAKAAIASGVCRILLGTVAIESPGLVRELCAKLGPDAVVVSIDARAGYAAIKGWTEQSRIKVLDLMAAMEEVGVRRFMYTDIARDGTLTEPNFQAIEHLAGCGQAHLMVGGGISSLRHLLRLAELPVEAAVVGKALYTGDIDLREAMETVPNIDPKGKV